MARACKFEVNTVARGADSFYPITRSGWSAAHRRGLEIASGGGQLALVDLVCPKIKNDPLQFRRIPLYQCARGRHGVPYCQIETFEETQGELAIMGALGRAARRRKRR